MPAPSLFARYKALVASRTIAFRLNGERNRPIYDFNSRLVSIPENAPLFVAAANLVHELAQCADYVVPEDLWIRARAIMEQKP